MAPRPRSLAPLALAAGAALAAACNFPRPADVADDVPADADPGTTLRVSLSGDDANDGITQPVKTLKHAIGLAAANSKVTAITLASGRYAVAGGEVFPYTVPANLTIIGPAGGGAILAGSMTEQGMILNGGALQDVELEDFTVAITATASATLTNLHVRTNMLAVRGETGAKLDVDNLDIAGKTGACATGIVLNGAAELTVKALATRGLGTTLDAKDQSAVTISSSSMIGDRTCVQGSTPVLFVASQNSLTVLDSIVDGGILGISAAPKAGVLRISITNTIVRNAKSIGILSGGGGTVNLTMQGGQLTDNDNAAQLFFKGTYSFRGVSASGNSAGFYVQETTLVMRNCTVAGSQVGIDLLTPVAVDLGTVADPGNNLFANSSRNLYYESGTAQIEAVGNTWAPGIQGADATGRYPVPQVISGPVTVAPTTNYYIGCDLGQ